MQPGDADGGIALYCFPARGVWWSPFRCDWHGYLGPDVSGPGGRAGGTDRSHAVNVGFSALNLLVGVCRGVGPGIRLVQFEYADGVDAPGASVYPVVGYGFVRWVGPYQDHPLWRSRSGEPGWFERTFRGMRCGGGSHNQGCCQSSQCSLSGAHRSPVSFPGRFVSGYVGECVVPFGSFPTWALAWLRSVCGYDVRAVDGLVVGVHYSLPLLSFRRCRSLTSGLRSPCRIPLSLRASRAISSWRVRIGRSRPGAVSGTGCWSGYRPAAR